MPLIFFPDAKEKQLFLIVWMVVLVFSLVFSVWYFFVRSTDSSSSVVLPPFFQEVAVPDVNLEFLENPSLSEMKLFEKFGLPDFFGRANPFAPY